MNYTQALIRQSIALWQALFGEEQWDDSALTLSTRQGLPAAEHTEHGARREMLQETAQRKHGEHVFAAASDEKSAPQEALQVLQGIRYREPAAEEGAGSSEYVQGQDPARQLLHALHRAETANAVGTSRAAEHGADATLDRQQMAGPASWSDYFERDARRYDGGYELM